MTGRRKVDDRLERELHLSEDAIREEHLSTVNVPAHWAYLFGVLGGGFVLMVLLMLALAPGS